MENRQQKEKIYRSINVCCLCGYMFWMAIVKKLRVILVLSALLLTHQQGNTAIDTGSFLSWLHFFDEQESSSINMKKGKELFGNLSIQLPSFALNKADTAFQYALYKINDSNASIEAKKQLSSVVIGLFCNEWNELNEENLPGKLILGGVEILIGALIHIIPGCDWIGKLIIADGIRRGFNGLEDIDNRCYTQKQMNESEFSNTRASDFEHINDWQENVPCWDAVTN